MLEKRKFLRIPHKAPVYGHIRFISELRDVSINGCFVETSTPVSEGTILEIEFSLPNTSRIIHAKGEVRWYGQYSSDRRAEMAQGVGIKFIDISLDDIGIISEFVKTKSSVKRKFRRATVTAAIRYSVDEQSLDQSAQAIDLSLGGLFIKTENILKLDDVIFMELAIPGVQQTIRCSGKIIYLNQSIPEIFRGMIFPGMGVEFIGISDKNLEILDKALEAEDETTAAKE